jgi:hypothetical protein
VSAVQRSAVPKNWLVVEGVSSPFSDPHSGRLTNRYGLTTLGHENRRYAWSSCHRLESRLTERHK